MDPFDWLTGGILNFGNAAPVPQIPPMQPPNFIKAPQLPTGGAVPPLPNASGIPPTTNSAIAQNPTLARAAAACGMSPGGAGGAAGGLGGNDAMSQLRKMMLMQSLLGGDEGGGAIQGPNGALPSGVGMKGSGGFQNDPKSMATLNSIPIPLPSPPRRRFLGDGG